MPLPVFPAPRTQDVAVTGWAALTVRVTWTLLCQRVRIRPDVLRDARDHVLYHLDPGTALEHAEDRAEPLTRAFVARARRRSLRDRWPQDAAMPLSPRWRRAIDNALRPLSRAVFRQHYGDGRSLDELAETQQVDRVALEGARGGLREVIRRVACDDGLPVQEWPTERLDALLRRLAAFTPGDCPPLAEVLEGEHPDHAGGCTRCDRTRRLLQAGILSEDDLRAPLGTARPSHTARVLALHFHPDGRHQLSRLHREFDGPSAPVGDDLLLLDFSDPEAVRELLVLATEVGAPHRDHLRGVVLEGPGRWSRFGLLGPLPDEASHAVRSRPWGTVETLGELPDTLPNPPSARGLWMGVAGLAAATLLLVLAALGPTGPTPDHDLQVQFSPGRGGVWADFDVDETALVTLVREREGALDVVLGSSHPADKIALAVGDGGYRVHTMGAGVLLASSADPLPPLQPMVEAASTSSDPLRDLAARIRQADPGADVHVMRRP